MRIENCKLLRSFFYKMSAVNPVQPPKSVRGMLHLDREKFDTPVTLTVLVINKSQISKLLPNLKKYILKMSQFKSLQEINEKQTKVLLSIKTWKDFDELDIKAFESCDVTESNLDTTNIIVTYDNYLPKDIFKAVLPCEFGFSGFSQIGHIIHLNLRERLFPYKYLISQVLLDKIPNTRSVVNKMDVINNTYRNFVMELLCGSSDMFVSVKENHCTFEFDFSEVYWNPRLSTEHDRIVSKMDPGDVLFDIFAGVGPFAIPAAKKKVITFANDLNPHSYQWLNYNLKKNKIDKSFLKTYNKDGHDFIKTDLKALLPTYINKTNIHILMNLPALAVEFLHSFLNLYTDQKFPITVTPVVHLYCFSKGENVVDIAKNLIIENVGFDISDKILEIVQVRTVSSFKEMMCVSFKLDIDILMHPHKLSLKRTCHDTPLEHEQYHHGEKQSKTDKEYH